MSDKTYILTLSCKDVRGIVAAVTGFLAEHYGFIIESAQFGDASTGQFFLRIEFSVDEKAPPEAAFCKKFEETVTKRFDMQWQLHDKAEAARVVVLVSKYGHCL